MCIYIYIYICMYPTLQRRRGVAAVVVDDLSGFRVVGPPGLGDVQLLI